MSQISVIVPVFNVEKYISRCIDSILAQTFTDFELILVNDGSTDNSLTICDSYSHNDPRVKVFDKSNGGASSARNFGIDAANGAFICFVDADDYINNNYLNDLYNDMQMSDVDLVMHGMVKLYNGKQITCSLENDNRYRLSDKDGFFQNTNLFRFCGPCCKLFKKDILDRFGIRFNQRIICAEDYDFFANYLMHCIDVRVSAIQNYLYESHENSVSSGIYSFDKEYSGLQELYVTLMNLCDKFDNDFLKFQVNRFLAYYVTRVLASVYKKPMVERASRLSNLKVIDRKYVCIFNQYDKPSTMFLKLTKYLFVRKYYRLYDLVYSLVVKS